MYVLTVVPVDMVVVMTLPLPLNASYTPSMPATGMACTTPWYDVVVVVYANVMHTENVTACVLATQADADT